MRLRRNTVSDKNFEQREREQIYSGQNYRELE